MLTSNDKEILLYRILSGKSFFLFNNEKYILKAASLEIRYEAALIYETIINDEKFQDWFREDNAELIMMSLGIWNSETNKNLKMLEQRLDHYKVELFTNFMIPSKTKNIRKDIKNTKNSINKIYSTKQNFLSNTLEGYANSIKNEYIICNTLYKNDQLVFDKEQNYQSFSLFNSLVQEIDKIMITTENFKALARDNIWRNYWNSSKNNLFNCATIELSDEQRALINISRMYDNIYEHPECPSDAIINDDDALEGWMIVQKRKNETAKKQNAFDSKNNATKNAGEVFVVADNNEDIESILEMNTSESRARLNEKLNFINSNNSEINDADLPDVQRDIMLGMKEVNKNNRKR